MNYFFWERAWWNKIMNRGQNFVGDFLNSFDSRETRRRQIIEFLQDIIDFFVHQGEYLRAKFLILH